MSGTGKFTSALVAQFQHFTQDKSKMRKKKQKKTTKSHKTVAQQGEEKFEDFYYIYSFRVSTFYAPQVQHLGRRSMVVDRRGGHKFTHLKQRKAIQQSSSLVGESISTTRKLGKLSKEWETELFPEM